MMNALPDLSGALPELAGEARRFGLISDWQHGPELGAVFVSGPDSGSFLHAQLTSDVASLGPGEGQLSARLNRKIGRASCRERV